ncbi:hypothetical protein HOY82DRAFT_591164 [Tuber indicum]|nr:hypothetical protein HOY82DRAFT_591164 [Tuber indicum]
MPLDPDFDRSRFVMKLYPYRDNEPGVATGATASCRLFDPGKALVLYTSPSLRKIAAPTSQTFSLNHEGGPEQLIAEVKGIYAGLVMVEAKCAQVDAKQAAATFGDGQTQPRLNDEQWQALVALHRTLPHEHHDFFLASPRPSASPPYGNWLTMYETVPPFENTWVECLGDLGRYRMAIEDGDVRDRDVWAGVARFWYSKATDKTPYIGRLFHHLAILARPNVLQQLFYYCKSLAVAQPFYPTRESILTLFDLIFSPEHIIKNHVDARFIKLHGINFTHIDLGKFDDTLFDHLGYIDIPHPRKKNPKPRSQATKTDAKSRSCTAESLSFSKGLAYKILSLSLQRIGDSNVLPRVYVQLVFLAYATRPEAGKRSWEAASKRLHLARS